MAQFIGTPQMNVVPLRRHLRCSSRQAPQPRGGFVGLRPGVTCNTGANRRRCRAEVEGWVPKR